MKHCHGNVASDSVCCVLKLPSCLFYPECLFLSSLRAWQDVVNLVGFWVSWGVVVGGQSVLTLWRSSISISSNTGRQEGRALACARTHTRANAQAISIDQDILLSLPKRNDKRIDDTLSTLPLAHNDGSPAAAERRWRNNWLAPIVKYFVKCSSAWCEVIYG